MRIKNHAKSYIVELEDDLAWRIWPCDLLTTLHWMPTTQFEVSEIDDDHCRTFLSIVCTGHASASSKQQRNGLRKRLKHPHPS